MCIVCEASRAASGYVATPVNEAGHRQSGQGTTGSSTGTGAQDIDALISGFRWTGTALTYSMPTVTTPYAGYDVLLDETASFQSVTASLGTAIRNVMQQFDRVLNVTFTEVTGTTSANMYLARTSETATAHAYLPDGYFKGGDVWFGANGDYDTPMRGDYAWATVMHEAGHALGLKHAHSFIGGTGAYEDNVGIISLPVSVARDSLEFSVMSYRSYISQDLEVFDYYTNEIYGYPQSLMMLDIAALQKMYGADFTTNSSATTYSFSATTGEMFINGVGQGAAGANRVFQTIWDGGGLDTYDFSNYTTNQTIDLTPGGWSVMSATQLANLGQGNFSRGNLFNALQFGSDTRSLIENASGGSGNDSLTGNAAANVLNGGAGSDTINGGTGADTMIGGTGVDFYTVDNTGDVITELASEGFDYAYASVSFTTWANVEYVITTGSAALTGTGNSQANAFDATGRFNGVTFLGLGGMDVFYGSNYADSIDGGDGNDIIVAYLSVNGADTLNGGAGDDVYYLYESGDVVVEGVGEGFDTLYTQADVTLAANVEQVVVYSAARVVVGNSGANNLFGLNSGQILTLDGGDGNDWVMGSNQGDTLVGGTGNDILQGLLGANRMEGGTGDDVFYSTSATDVIVEYASEGRDTVYANYSMIALADNVEQLVLFDGATVGNGNSLDNTLYGNNNTVGINMDGGAGADLIFGSNFGDVVLGGTGNDTMLGLAGNDAFHFTTAGNLGADTILDFDANPAGGQDVINIRTIGYVAGSIGSDITVVASGADTLISFTSGSLAGTTITLAGVAAANVDVADFVFA